MGEFADKMGTKDPGNLILAEDWNDLVAEMDKVNGDVEAVTETASNNESQIIALGEQISTAMDALANLETAITTLRQRFRRIRLNTSRARFAIGEQGEISAQVTDVEGNPLTFPNVNDRPWVDFVTVWGQFRAVSGFTSRGGEDNRTISVQVNSQGIAQVRLSADHAGAVAEEAADEVTAVLETRHEAIRIVDHILESNTPMEANLNGAFHALNLEYERTDTMSFRHYVDQYYISMPYHTVPGYRYRHNWRDYRTTVIAFVKEDNDPLTADLNLAGSSIQVTFRDWISPWINIGYFGDIQSSETAIRERLIPRVNEDYMLTSQGWLDEITGYLSGRGIIGRQKGAMAAERALGGLTVTDPPPFMGKLTQTFRQAMAFQQSINYSQNISMEQGEVPVALNLVGDLDSKSQGDSQAFQVEMQAFVNEQVDETRTSLNNEIRASQQQFRDDLMADSGAIRNLERQVSSINGVMGNLQDFNVNDAQVRLNLVDGLNIRLQALEGRG